VSGTDPPEEDRMAKDKQPTNGPYSWGNGPQPKRKCCSYAEAGKAITRLEFRLAARFVRMDIKSRLGLI
jgi:hypothetical protein